MYLEIPERYATIDPMALILKGDVYLKWLEIHHPHEPKVAELEQVVKALTHDERIKAVSNARMIAKYCNAFMDAASKVK
jgi:hypothetical protein